MRSITKEKGLIIFNVLQGVPFSFAFRSEDLDWSTVSGLAIEIKRVRDINERAIVRLEVGKGLSVNGDTVSGVLDGSQTDKLPNARLYWDLKGLRDGQIIAIMAGEIRIINTVTKL